MFLRLLRSPFVVVGVVFLIQGVIGMWISITRLEQLGNVGPAFVSEWERSVMFNL